MDTEEFRCTFNSALNWATVVLFFYFLDKIWISTQKGILLCSFVLHPQLLHLDVVPPFWWNAGITLTTVPWLLIHQEDLLSWSQDGPARPAPTICPF